ncbi:MAG: thioredoxin [Armatimonadetes bacterium]|nr:thioredoxin [Armatimonadota bacterium]
MQTINGDNFEAEVLKAETPVLVDFSADWCSPCKRMEPILKKVAGTYEGRVKVVKVNADDDQPIAAKYQVKGLPTLIMFSNGEPVARKSGFQPEDQLTRFVEEHSF